MTFYKVSFDDGRWLHWNSLDFVSKENAGVFIDPHDCALTMQRFYDDAQLIPCQPTSDELSELEQRYIKKLEVMRASYVDTLDRIRRQ